MPRIIPPAFLRISPASDWPIRADTNLTRRQGLGPPFLRNEPNSRFLSTAELMHCAAARTARRWPALGKKVPIRAQSGEGQAIAVPPRPASESFARLSFLGCRRQAGPSMRRRNWNSCQRLRTALRACPLSRCNGSADAPATAENRQELARLLSPYIFGE